MDGARRPAVPTRVVVGVAQSSRWRDLEHGARGCGAWLTEEGETLLLLLLPHKRGEAEVQIVQVQIVLVQVLVRTSEGPSGARS